MTSRSTLSLSLRRPLVPVVAGVSLVALLASGVAYSATGKTANLALDGQSSEVDFRGQTVADVLDAADLEVGEHDLLVPSAETAVEDGESVSLRRGRPLELVVDGEKRTVWVTADSVDEALDQVGLAGEGLALSASRSRGIPLDGLSLQVSTPKPVTIKADGATQQRSTAVPTVDDALFEARVVLDGDDRITPGRTTPVTPGMTINVVRVATEQVVEKVGLPFGTQRRDDASVVKGQTKTLQAGKEGVAERTVSQTWADGQVESRAVVSTRTVSAPVDRVIAVGTKPRPAPAPAPAQRAASSSSSSSSSASTSSGGLNWAALANCESGGNPAAVSSTGKYRGLYQFSYATWASVGGSGDPAANSAGEQTRRAQILHDRSGRGQWPTCGRLL